MKDFSKAEDYFNDFFFLHWLAFSFGCYEIHTSFSLFCWKTDCSPRISRMMPKCWLPCTLVYALQELMEATKMLCCRKKIYKSVSFRLGENTVAGSCMSVMKGPQTATNVSIAWLWWQCVKDYVGPQASHSWRHYFKFWLSPLLWRISLKFCVLKAEKSLLFWLGWQTAGVSTWEWRFSSWAKTALWK